jgi:hypothetical protein
MKIIKRNSEVGTKDIFIKDGNKTFAIVFGGTGDLYWIINNKDCKNYDGTNLETFTITQENYQLYNLFQILYSDIENINIYDNKEVPSYIDTYQDYHDYLKELELEKIGYRKNNNANYHELFNPKEKTITWYSDETGHDVANILKIKKNAETFSLTFSSQPYIDGYERETNPLGTISIRFRNSGSTYEPFNIAFMKMFHGLENLDDINDYGHQYHIGEYLHMNKQMTKTKLKN